jgi:hypothetical protein
LIPCERQRLAWGPSTNSIFYASVGELSGIKSNNHKTNSRKGFRPPHRFRWHLALLRLNFLAVRGGERFLRNVFEPLGYELAATRCPLDERMRSKARKV